MIPPRRKPGVRDTRLQNSRRSNRAEPTGELALSQAEAARAAVVRLRRICAELDQLELPTGPVGCALLDALELANQIHNEVRAKAREALLEEPGLIPHWSAQESAPARELSRDAVVVFERLHATDPTLTARLLLQASAPTLSGLLKLQYVLHPGTPRPEVEAKVERLLEGLLKLREPVVRYSA